MTKKINLIFTANSVTSDLAAGRTVIIFDVLRATSTITTALAHGAKAILPVLEPEKALKLRSELKIDQGQVLLGGERKGMLIPGFDLGNSPLEYNGQKVKNKTIIFTTTNGTRAIINSIQAGANRILIGSLLNRAAIVKGLQQETAVSIVCAGIEGRFAFEDFMAAGLLITALNEPGGEKWTLDDGAMAALSTAIGYSNYAESIANCFHGQRLQWLGKSDDVDFCVKLDRFDILPVYEQGLIHLSEKA